jgi:hypothetical protein
MEAASSQRGEYQAKSRFPQVLKPVEKKTSKKVHLSSQITCTNEKDAVIFVSAFEIPMLVKRKRSKL